jgi:hypothetical protein
MQLIPRYLVNNRTTVVVNDSGFTTEYRPVYTRNLKVYRGIDNKLEFKLLNADQKPISLTSKTVKLVAFDEDRNQILSETGSNHATIKGLATITISENDLLNVKDQFLSYAIHVEDANQNKTITYSNVHFENNGVMQVSSSAYPGPKDSKSITTFSQTGLGLDVWVSESISAEPGINGNEAVHTAAIYSDTFVGEVSVEVTLDNQVDNDTNWATATTVSINNATQPTPVNFVGVYNYVRFKTTADPANKISNILVRN